MKTRLTLIQTAALLLILSTINYAPPVFAQGTAFTYQGRLNDGTNPANGSYDFQFRVFDTAPLNTGTSLGSPNPNSTNAVPVTNGLFTVTLDFGNNPFATGAARWLEIAVRTNGNGSFAILNPRQPLTATPYAITASNITGVVPSAGVAGTYSSAVTLNNTANSFTGNGSGLTDVNALTLGGVGPNGFWRATGNAGTTPGPNFLGTTDNQPLEIHVNGTRALLIEPTGGAPSLIGGYYQNGAGGPGAVVVGGGTSGSINQALGMYSFVGAGHGAQAGPFGAVVGGAYNVSPGQFSFLGSGLANTNQATGSVIVGGTNNLIQAGSDDAAVLGGGANTIRANSSFATISGGSQNEIHENAGLSAIGGGWLNKIHTTADQSVIAGGNANEIFPGARESFVGGGFANLIHTNAYNSVIGGGAYNIISNAALATIAGGLSNLVQGASDTSFIGGGRNNWIQPGSVFATIAGGDQNLIGFNAGAASIAGGFVNTIESGAGSSSIAGGNGNWIQGGATYSAIGGGYYNTIQSNATIATIGGGGANTIQSNANNSTIGGGVNNSIQTNAANAVICGGHDNTIQSASHAAIGGGGYNLIQLNAYDSTIGGGGYNTIQANAHSSVIGGGNDNTVSGIAATIPGGNSNVASGDSSLAAGSYSTASGFIATALGQGVLASGSGAVALGSFTAATNQFSMAAGQQAQALHQGAFVWADSQNAAFTSTANDQFSIRAQGGVQLNTDTSIFFGNQTRQMLNLWGNNYGIGVQSYTMYFRSDSGGGFSWFEGGAHADSSNNPGTGGIELMRLDAVGNLRTLSGVIAPLSDRNTKMNLEPVSPTEVLERVATLPLSRWSYKTDPNSRHLGPMAQDFYAAFGVGLDDKSICTVDADGVALAAIQGLNQKLEEQRVQLDQKQTEITELKQRLERLEKMLSVAADQASR